jgi:hypothetical protein
LGIEMLACVFFVGTSPLDGFCCCFSCAFFEFFPAGNVMRNFSNGKIFVFGF